MRLALIIYGCYPHVSVLSAVSTTAHLFLKSADQGQKGILIYLLLLDAEPHVGYSRTTVVVVR